VSGSERMGPFLPMCSWRFCAVGARRCFATLSDHPDGGISRRCGLASNQIAASFDLWIGFVFILVTMCLF